MIRPDELASELAHGAWSRRGCGSAALSYLALERSQTFDMSAEHWWRMPFSFKISSVAARASLWSKTILSVNRPENVNSTNWPGHRARVRPGASGCGCELR